MVGCRAQTACHDFPKLGGFVDLSELSKAQSPRFEVPVLDPSRVELLAAIGCEERCADSFDAYAACASGAVEATVRNDARPPLFLKPDCGSCMAAVAARFPLPWSHYVRLQGALVAEIEKTIHQFKARRLAPQARARTRRSKE